MAAAAGVRLSRMSSPLEHFVQNGYRWLAGAAVCLGVGGTIQQLFGGLIGGPEPLRIGDLISLAALPALVIGIATLTTDQTEADRGAGEPSRWRPYQDVSAQARPSAGVALGSALLVVSLFAICLVVLFAPDYQTSGSGASAFALDLIRPVADLAALGLVLPLVPRGPRLTALPVLALVAVTAGDSLAVAGRAADLDPGLGSHLALVAALGLLAASLAVKPASGPGAWPARARLAAPVCAAAAAVVIAAYAVSGHLLAVPAVAVTAALVVILLAIRLAMSARQAFTVTASAQASGGVFQALADSTSDTVLICDSSGKIDYISHGGGEFGYDLDTLTGSPLADIVHPEDRQAGIRAAMIALRGSAGTATFSGRARGADGSWRQISAALSRYEQPGEPARLLITCHDESELVAIRRELTALTFHDGLTGLPNRAYLEDRVKDLTQGGDQRGSVAALVIGLDGMSAVQDLGGPSCENLVLAQAGRRLRAGTPPGAIVARWNRDQFAILIGDLSAPDLGFSDLSQVAELAERLASSIGAEPFSIATREIGVTASVGVAMSPADHSDQVLGNAQVAMAKAAAAGGGRVEVFSAEMDAQARRRSELAVELDEALAGHRLQLEYEPVVDLASARVIRVVALLRWCQDGEAIGIDELLSVAQESGLLASVNDWMLREACEQVAAWRAAGPVGSVGSAGPALGLAISCSARQLGLPGFAGSVLSALAEAGLPPQALTLQVAERVLIDATGPAGDVLAGLRDGGVRLAIDDFGTGYASLSYLRLLAVDAIKIDSSFTAGLGADPTMTLLMTAIVSLGRDLGIELTAAGVDRPDQAELLAAMGCGLGQGAWLGSRRPGAAVDPATAGLAASWTGLSPELTGHSVDHVDHSVDQAGDPACSPAS